MFAVWMMSATYIAKGARLALYKYTRRAWHVAEPTAENGKHAEEFRDLTPNTIFL